MKASEIFIKLCKTTLPYDSASNSRAALAKEFIATIESLAGVKFMPVGDPSCPDAYRYSIGKTKTMFCAHIDTADSGLPKKINLVVGDNKIVGTDGTTILGADDRSGITILIALIRANVPGEYVLFDGEERGLIGSHAVSQTDAFKGFDHAIAWDRKSYGSLITHQSGVKCVSDEFATKLISEYRNQGVFLIEDNGGSYTDTYSFTDQIKECTNISIGYFGAHTVRETQDLAFLDKMAEASVCIDWSSLPAKEIVVKQPAYKYPKYSSNTYSWKGKNDWKDDWRDDWSDYRSSSRYDKFFDDIDIEDTTSMEVDDIVVLYDTYCVLDIAGSDSGFFLEFPFAVSVEQLDSAGIDITASGAEYSLNIDVQTNDYGMDWQTLSGRMSSPIEAYALAEKIRFGLYSPMPEGSDKSMPVIKFEIIGG